MIRPCRLKNLLWGLQPPLCFCLQNLFVSVWRSQGHLGRITHWPHPVVVGISTNLFVREETVSWYAYVIPYRVSRPFWCCFMRTLYKFCAFVSGRHCRYFEGKFGSLAVLFYVLLNWDHRMQATAKSSLPNFDSFEIPVPMLLVFFS